LSQPEVTAINIQIPFTMAPSHHSPSFKSLPSRDNISPGIFLTDSYSQLPATPKGLTPLTSKVTSVLSTTHSDAEFRDALSLLDERGIRNDAESRRRIRLDFQREVIDSNGEVIAEFGRVAEVRFLLHSEESIPTQI
jgi:hypothetical protein